MKKVLSVLAIAALFLVGITSCTQEKTATELLTQKNGWVLLLQPPLLPII